MQPIWGSTLQCAVAAAWVDSLPSLPCSQSTPTLSSSHISHLLQGVLQGLALTQTHIFILSYHATPCHALSPATRPWLKTMTSNFPNCQKLSQRGGEREKDRPTERKGLTENQPVGPTRSPTRHLSGDLCHSETVLCASTCGSDSDCSSACAIDDIISFWFNEGQMDRQTDRIFCSTPLWVRKKGQPFNRVGLCQSNYD